MIRYIWTQEERVDADAAAPLRLVSDSCGPHPFARLVPPPVTGENLYFIKEKLFRFKVKQSKNISISFYLEMYDAAWDGLNDGRMFQDNLLPAQKLCAPEILTR